MLLTTRRRRAHITAAVGLLLFATALAVAITLPGAVRGATHAVSIGDGSFGPAALTVAVGDTVTWTNDDDSPHTATADGGAFASANLDPGQSFSFTFTSAGSFGYVCSYHDEMVGTITVAAGPAAVPTAQAAAPTAAPATATAAQPSASHTAGAHAANQPNTALPAPVATAAWIAPLLIGLGLVAIAFGLVPSPRPVTERARVIRGGWRR